MISVESLVKVFPATAAAKEVRAVNDVTFTVSEGEFYTLLGPSGCGKSTTMRCIAGLERPTSGRLNLNGVLVASDAVFVPANRRDIGMVFQSYAVWPHMSVFENVAFPLRAGRRRARGRELRTKVENALELVGLGDLSARGATQLSGGQQQRLALARAIVAEPQVLILDEPLSNLDAKLRERMRSEVRLLQRRLGITTVFVTHDQTEALSMSDRVAVMNHGRIVQEGTPREIYFGSTEPFVASFIGSTNLFEGTVADSEERAKHKWASVMSPIGLVQCATRHSVGEGARVLVAIRPDDVKLHVGHGRTTIRHQNVFPGVVEVDLFGGTHTDYSIRVADALTLRVALPSADDTTRLERGAHVAVELPPDSCRLLLAANGRDAAIEGETVNDDLMSPRVGH